MKEIELPKEWKDYSLQQKDLWFARHVIKYVREGEIDGIVNQASDEVKKAYVEFLKENNK